MPTSWARGYGVALALLGAQALAAQPVHIPPGAKYVAIGSSFAAGPGVARRAPGSPIGCGRSDYNYAHLIAERHHLALDDVTCSGATTADVLTRAQLGQPPQIDAVDAATRLVTITIGGNDVSYLGNLISASCLARHPESTRCHVVDDAEVEQVFATLAQRMTTVIAETRARAPAATIALVDYFTVVPDQGECEARMPLSPPQISAARAVGHRLAEITEAVAAANHVRLVKLSAVSEHHDVCARDPWILGFEPPIESPDFRTPPYHPNVEGMAGAADAIDKALFRAP